MSMFQPVHGKLFKRRPASARMLTPDLEELQELLRPMLADNEVFRSYVNDTIKRPADITITLFSKVRTRRASVVLPSLNEFVTGQTPQKTPKQDFRVSGKVRGFYLPNSFAVTDADGKTTTQPLLLSEHKVFFRYFERSASDPTTQFGVIREQGSALADVFPTYVGSMDQLVSFFEGHERDDARRHLGHVMLQRSLGIQ